MAFVYPDADGTVKGLLQSVNRSFQSTPPEPDDGRPLQDWLPEFPLSDSDIPAGIQDLPVPILPHPTGPIVPEKPSVFTNSPEAPKRRLGQPASAERNDPEKPTKRRKTEENLPTNQEYSEREDSHGSEPSSEGPDWRRLLCTLVEAEIDSDDATLVEGIVGVGRILRRLANLNKPVPPPSPPEPIYTVLHRLYCDALPRTIATLDTDPPYVSHHYGAGSHLDSGNRVTNLDLYIERNRHASFIVFREYFCCSERQREPVDGTVEAQSEKLVVMSGSLLRILLQVRDAVDDGNMLFPDLKLGVELERPHLWTFFAMKHLEDMEQILEDEEDKKHLRLFLSYFRDKKKAEHTELETLLSQKMITPKFLEYLFIPSQLLLRRDIRGPDFLHAAKQVTWPEAKYAWSKKDRPNMAEATGLGRKPEVRCKIKLEFKTSFWSFDGNFHQVEKKEDISQTFIGDKPLKICDFPLHPLAHADPLTRSLLEKRGKIFWTCRKRRYVEYSGAGCDGNVLQPGTRFMIDTEAFNQTAPRGEERLKDDLGPRVMSQEEPPGGDFVLLLPAVILGFHMQDKKWQPLLVSNISDVVWDKDVFDTLVLPADTKDLIMALVTNKIAADQPTDFFQGKGTGLVILFHGPPGTGKTLTAESVAELANKPLYRVTCGDIGTNPEGVEKYLKRVLWLGKNWDCVVLLDEAEVFLQERATNDIQRNALVSIFLRTLEYYDGILVLTSNRVGTFDEGFKSRIQLAIQYEKLNETSRGLIWENFINRIETFKSDDIDIRDLRRHLNDLAHYNMNGRQIRNAVTTGRQLAMFKKKPLDFDCLKHVINVSSRFDKYLTTINEGMEDEDLAREDRFR